MHILLKFMVKKRKKTPTKKNTFLLCLNLDTFKSLNIFKNREYGKVQPLRNALRSGGGSWFCNKSSWKKRGGWGISFTVTHNGN